MAKLTVNLGGNDENLPQEAAPVSSFSRKTLDVSSLEGSFKVSRRWANHPNVRFSVTFFQDGAHLVNLDAMIQTKVSFEIVSEQLFLGWFSTINPAYDYKLAIAFPIGDNFTASEYHRKAGAGEKWVKTSDREYDFSKVSL